MTPLLILLISMMHFSDFIEKIWKLNWLFSKTPMACLQAVKEEGTAKFVERKLMKKLVREISERLNLLTIKGWLVRNKYLVMYARIVAVDMIPVF